jgi:hypothetical protein
MFEAFVTLAAAFFDQQLAQLVYRQIVDGSVACQIGPLGFPFWAF